MLHGCAQRVLDHCVSFAVDIPLARTVVATIHFMKTRRTAALVMSSMEWWVVSTCTLRVNLDANYVEPIVLLPYWLLPTFVAVFTFASLTSIVARVIVQMNVV
jgi:hypothetical protein